MMLPLVSDTMQSLLQRSDTLTPRKHSTGSRRVFLTVKHRGASGEVDYYSRRGADAKAATVDQGSAHALKHPVRQSHCLLEAADASSISSISAKLPVEEPSLGPQWQAKQVSRATNAEADSGADVKFVPKKRRRDATGTANVSAELPLRKRVRFAEGTNFEMKPPPEWKKARLDQVHHGDDDVEIDDECANHMGTTEVEDVADEAPPIVSNGDEDVYETDDEDYNYDGPTPEDVQRVMAEEAQAEICNYPPSLAHAHAPPPAEEEPRNAFFLSDPQPAAMAGGLGLDVPWSIEQEEKMPLLREPSPPPPPPPSQNWMPREVHDLTPPNHRLPPASISKGTHARGSSRAKREHKHSKHRVDRGSAGVHKAQSSHRQRSNPTTAQQACHGSAGSAIKRSGSAPPAAQKLSKEQLRRNQFLDWYMNEATKEEKEQRREMLRHNRNCFSDAHIESAPTAHAKQDIAHSHSRANPASSVGLKRSHQALPRKKSANYNRQAQSGGYPTPDTIPSTPKPSASLLTDIQQQANVNTEKAVRATSGNASQSTKLKALKVCLLAAAGHLKQAAEVTANATSSDHARCLALLQSAFHAVEGAAQAVQVPLQDSFLQQAYSLLIMKLRSACQLRLRLAERKLVRSTGQEPSAEQEQDWKLRGACAASLLTEGSSSSRRGALHRAALDSSLGTLDEKQRIRKLILDLRPDFSATKNCM